MPVISVTGLGWGDEGKGKIIDLLSSKADIIVRGQGGHNAGHTVIAQGKEYHFHVIPSGILYPHTQCLIGGGVIIDPKSLLQELHMLEKENIPAQNRIKISYYAHVIFPYHVLIDQLQEKAKGDKAIGTTGRGIGPCFIDRTARQGIRIAELLSPEMLKARLTEILPQKNKEIQTLGGDPIHLDDVYVEYCEYANALRPFIHHVEAYLSEEIDKGSSVLLEGAQGALLDVVYGTYPYVTSCSTIASGIASGAGVGPTRVDHVVGVLKAYATRVGSGPFPTEDNTLFQNHDKDLREEGTTTGRKRRLGWFDAVATKFAVQINGIDGLAITKLDILDSLDTIKICVAYELAGKKINHFPVSATQLEKVQPIYEELPGWKCSTQNISTYDKLPENAKHYVQYIRALCQCPLDFLSTGPARHETLIMNDPLSKEKGSE